MKKYTETEICSYWLASQRGITASKYFSITDEFIDVCDLFERPNKLEDSALSQEIISKLKKRAKLQVIERELQELENRGISVSTILSADYPHMLNQIAVPPPILYFKGNMAAASGKTFAVIGARKCTRSGIKNATDISRALAENGVSVVAGMARGIDTAAHAGALEGVGTTVAVLGGGVDVVYPPENDSLYREICKYGVVMSEFPPGTEPYGYNFPIRNRIISGISHGILVVQGSRKSGASITVNHALDENRDVFAMPGDISVEQSSLPNYLIHSGSKMVLDVSDILDYYGWDNNSKSKQTAKVDVSSLDFLQLSIYNLLTQGDLSSQQIIDELDFGVEEITPALTMLEIMGFIDKLPGNMYSVKL